MDEKSKSLVEKMMAKAIEKYGEINMCNSVNSWEDSLTIEPFLGIAIFWFNVKNDTYSIREPL